MNNPVVDKHGIFTFEKASIVSPSISRIIRHLHDVDDLWRRVWPLMRVYKENGELRWDIGSKWYTKPDGSIGSIVDLFAVDPFARTDFRGLYPNLNLPFIYEPILDNGETFRKFIRDKDAVAFPLVFNEHARFVYKHDHDKHVYVFDPHKQKFTKGEREIIREMKRVAKLENYELSFKRRARMDQLTENSCSAIALMRVLYMARTKSLNASEDRIPCEYAILVHRLLEMMGVYCGLR